MIAGDLFRMVDPRGKRRVREGLAAFRPPEATIDSPDSGIGSVDIRGAGGGVLRGDGRRESERRARRVER
jgi:hypothetical protein